MCGVFSLAHSATEVGLYFGYHQDVQFPPRDVVAPGQPIAIVRNEEKLENPAREFAWYAGALCPDGQRKCAPANR